MRYIEIDAGMAIRGYIRKVLKDFEFKGYRIWWEEDKGFFSSDFRIRGEAEDIKKLCVIFAGMGGTNCNHDCNEGRDCPERK
jgi:hypothetical protein